MARYVWGGGQDVGRGAGRQKFPQEESRAPLLFGRNPEQVTSPQSLAPLSLINYMGWGWGRSKEGSLLRPCLGLMSQNPADMWAVRTSMENSTGSETVLKVRVQA